ncbi:MAG TPA: leucine/isoleucine/valine transporter permease subunit [Actinomycetota bacterium]|nr:leucine/isoleucine/valine transporter permease subunit [Actinomycetota bacterium]
MKANELIRPTAAQDEPEQRMLPPEFTVPSLAKSAVRAGLLGGVVVIFLSAVGMIEKFQTRNLISNQITVSRLLLALPPFIVAYLVVRPRVIRGKPEEVPPRPAIMAGAIAGATTGALTIAAVALWQVFDPLTVRNIFVALSPTLMEILTFEESLAVAALIWVVGGAALGAAGGGVREVPERFRRPLFIGFWTVLIVGILQRVLPQLLFELGLTTGWLYSSIFGGLTVSGALLIFVVATGLGFLWTLRRPQIQRVLQERREQRAALSLVGFIVVGLVLIVLPHLLGSVLTNILGRVGIFVLMGLGLNIVVGFAGLLDLGYVAFFAVGAYFLALLSGANLVTSLGATQDPSFSMGLNFYTALPFVVLIAAFIGMLIGAPVLRLRGDYLAIVTLGFGEIARILVTSNALRNYTGGAQGLRDVTSANVLGIDFRSPQNFYYLVLALLLVAVYISLRLLNSRTGRAWAAMREDEQVAEAMGVSTVKYKLLAFAMGGAVGSFSGAMFVIQVGTVQPDSFGILVSISALAVVILGGMGSIKGVIVGGLALIGIPELLAEFEEFRLLVYGAVIMAMMILKPEGLLPNVRRMRELHEEEKAQDAWARTKEGQAPGPVPEPVVSGAAEAGEAPVR